MFCIRADWGVGDFTLVKQLEEQGYGWLTEQQ